MVKRGHLAALLVLTAGCSTILGFQDGTPAPEASAPCEAGCGGDGGVGADGGRAVITRFEGAPGGIVAFNGYVYFTYGNGVWGCSTSQPCPSPVSMFTDGSETRPLALFGSRVAWGHPLLGKVRYCFFSTLQACSTTSGFDEPGVQAITADFMGNLYWLRTDVGTGTSELRVYPSSGYQVVTTLAVVPGASTSAAIAATGPRFSFVMVGGVAYSVVTPQGLEAGVGVVAPLVDADADAGLAAQAVAAGIVTPAARVVWPRGKAGGLWQCPIDETRTAPCSAGAAAPFAGAGDDITALAASNDTVVWARESNGKSDIFTCQAIAGIFTTAACTPVPVANDIAGRVAALTIEAKQSGPFPAASAVYFIVSEAGGGQRLERAQLP